MGRGGGARLPLYISILLSIMVLPASTLLSLVVLLKNLNPEPLLVQCKSQINFPLSQNISDK